MNFPWNIAKSAEGMFSQWAVKSICKFVLKKKLGQFILGDIHLGQLDVQLREGTIQLSDLALDVDSLNEKFGAAASLIIKEGSIGSLLVTMPWTGKGFEVEVDELELILAPCPDGNTSAGDETCTSSQDGNNFMHHESGNLAHDLMDNAGKSTSSDVHKGVKTIAKMVKWLLTKFHVKIKKLIVAYDPCLAKDKKDVGTSTALVLRISEIECGTCVSEDPSSNNDAKVDSFFGISCLTNFTKFQGATLDLLQMDNIDNKPCFSCVSGTSFDEPFTGFCLSNGTTPIMTGKGGGISGSLKLSIPWKDGSLDIRRVDADVYIDPVELRFQPSTIKWLLLSWDSYKNFDKDGIACMPCKSTDSVYCNSTSHFSSSISVSSVVPTDKEIPGWGSFSADLSSPNGQDSVPETMLPVSNFISDWIQYSVNINQKDTIEEVDFGASMDQFFECFDEMRSSRSALGSSGMWNWTGSVFTAITAASSLASGSSHIPSEHQHVQTNLQATIAGISIVLSFYDEGNQKCDGMGVNYVGAECRDILVSIQVCPQEMSLEGTMKYIEVADYLCNENDVLDFDFRGSNTNIESRTELIKNLQAQVQGVLPQFISCVQDPESDKSSGPVGDAFLSANNDASKTMLLRALGVTHFRFTVNSKSSDGSLTGPKLFSLNLPPFIFWLDFHLVNKVLNLLEEVGKSVEIYKRTGFSENQGSSYGNEKRAPGPGIRTLSSAETLRGNISIPTARLIMCFPFESGKETGHNYPWDQFIAFDILSPASSNQGINHNASPVLDGCRQKTFISSAPCSLHINVGILDMYLVTSACEGDAKTNSCNTQRKLSSYKVLSVGNREGNPSVISLLWQEGIVTGPWIAEKAKFLATLEESTSRNKFNGKGYEFATVTAVKDLEDTYSQTREEIILSSKFCLHFRLSPVTIQLGTSQYRHLHCLLDQIKSGLSPVAGDATSGRKESSQSQSSILLECDFVEILIRPETKKSVRRSIQSELPGSWECLKLRIKKFDLLSVSNIGGICGADFFWLAHGEGELWGSVTTMLDEEFLLISCSNSTLKRGDGGGSNALSSRLAGSDIILLQEPENLHDYTSMTIRCSTILAVGGRLDWLEVIASFFSKPSPETEQAVNNSQQKGDADAPRGASFILNFVDVGLSYEPYIKNLVSQSVLHRSSSNISNAKEEMGEPYVGCLLAASSLKFSSTTVAASMSDDYKIRLQDVGLLLSTVLEPERLGGTYSVEYLSETGYVKVAEEALIEATLRMNCSDALLWELECPKSHICIETCSDTMSGLIRLGAQLQQLFAPDVEESIVHLQTRWNNVQKTRERNDLNDEGGVASDDSGSQMQSLSVDPMNESQTVGLMNEISEDAFHLDGSSTCQFNLESQNRRSLDQSFLEEASLNFESPNALSYDLSVNGSAAVAGQQSGQASFLENDYLPELIESYCLSDLRPLSGLSAGREISGRNQNLGSGDLGRGSSGWYGDSSLRIVEDHIREISEHNGMKQFPDWKSSSDDFARSDEFGSAMGRVLLKNINIRWRLYAGSDWCDSMKNNDFSAGISRRDATVCLELALSGIQCQYDIFPAGGICVSRLSLSVQDFHVYDRSKAAPWKLVLGYYNSKDHPRESSSNAFKLDLEAVRPDPLTPLEEYRLRVAFLPMLLHLHQSQLDFLISFFGSKGSSVDQSSGCLQDLGASGLFPTKSDNIAGHSSVDEALLPYFQKFDIWPIRIRVDYSPQRIDVAALGAGKYVELVNLVPWKGVVLQLKHVHATGIYGWGNACEVILGEWLEDISQNQIHKVLRGIPTIRSLFAVGNGAAKLVSLPVASYRKDQRLLKGMQRGTIAFLRSISLEAVGLGVHLAARFHDILLEAEYFVSSIPPSLSLPASRTNANVMYNQPKNAQEGIHQAYESISDGLGKSASALVRTPLKRYQRGASAGSALATAVRAVPTAAVAPLSACVNAVHCAVLGLRNSLDPERKKESMEKYLGPMSHESESINDKDYGRKGD